MKILGISCYYHDAAAALLSDGVLAAAAQEERFTRKKHDPDFPLHALEFCLRQAGISDRELDYVVFYDKPFIKFERLLQTYIATFPFGLPSYIKALPVWLKEKLWVRQQLREQVPQAREVLFTEHHQAHAASAFFCSPFEEAAILTLDGVGEWETTTSGFGRGTSLALSKSIVFPHSLGLLYSAFTYYLGFKVNSAEYKVMGLAPYGEPRFYDLILKELVDLKDDGSFRLNLRYFEYHVGLRMTGRAFERLLGQPRREPESGLTQFHKDVAASIQKATDTIVVAIARSLQRQTRLRNLCMAGGVALNCVTNSKVLEESGFQGMFVQPAAGDAGGALGAALYVQHAVLHQPRTFVMDHAFWGPEFSNDQIDEFLVERGIPFKRCRRNDLLQQTASALADQQVVGWFQGRMEYGPRSLGSRSILADARNPKNQSIVNLKIKFRESFRPFAPTILEERTSEYFAWDRQSPFMLFVAQARDGRNLIPAVTHVDGSARLQTINRQQNELFYDLISEFDRQTGCPVLINTSFNVRGEPIVCSLEDAWKCFKRTEMDVLVLGNYILDKKQMSGNIFQEMQLETFEPD